jgi:hypothetical protein
MRYEVARLFIAFSAAVASMTCAAQSIDDEEEIEVSRAMGQDVTGMSVPSAPTASVTEEVEEQSWGMPPMPWRAQLGLDASTTKSGSNFSSNTFSKRLSASTSSYIWQPWFLGLSGSLSASQSDSSSNTGKTRGNSFSGALSANVLPRSRYPATISLGYGTTSSSGQSSTGNADHQNFNWNQRYTPIDRGYNADWQYAWNSFGLDGKRTESNRLGGTLAVSLATEAPQSLRFNTALSNAKSPDGGAGTNAGLLAGEHSIYLEDYVMSISTNGSISRDEVKSVGQQSAISQLQMGTSMDWIPSDDYPLRITAGVRYYDLGIEAKSETASSQSGVNTADVNFSATYPLDNNWSFSLSGNALATRFDGGDTISENNVYTLNTGANWRGDGITQNFDNWLYVLSYGSSVSVGYVGFEGDTESPSGSTAFWSSNIGNSFSRNYVVDGHQNPIALSVTQTIGVSEGFGSAGGRSSQSTQSLNHAANANWKPDGDAGTQTSIQFGLADGRSFGDSNSYHQSVTGSVARQWLLGNYQSLSGSVSLGFSQQGTDGSGDGWKGSGGASLAYGHARFANVNGLLYSLNYSVALRPYDTASVSQTDSKWALEHLLTQSWSWRYGLLSWALTNTNSVSPVSDFSSSIWLTVTRDFGGVL